MKLKRNFYLRPTVKVAKDLIGKFLVRNCRGPSTGLRAGKIYQAMITETEAYHGFSDKACHGHKSRTKRNEVMFLHGGFAYVYIIYGIYHCLNLTTGDKDVPSAVLIRGLDFPNADGPGKLCKAFKITKENCNGLDVTGDTLYVEDRGIKPKIEATKRIGIDYAEECRDWLW